MKRDHRKVRTIAVAIAFVLMGTAASAQSVGVYRGASDAKDASIASAGSAVGTTPVAALSWNPAGLASVEGKEVDVALAAISARGSFAKSRRQQWPAE